MSALRRRFGSRPLLCLLSLLGFLCFPTHRQAPGQEPALLRFAVIGDSGTGDAHQYRIAQQMLAWHDRLPYEVVLMLGDNIYGGLFGLGGGNKKDFEKKFDQPYAGLRARGVVFRAALGNHDMRHREGGDLIDAYDRFHIEGEQGYYSFTAGEWHPAAQAGAEHLFRTEKDSASPEQEAAPLVEFFVINTVRLEKNKQDPEQLAWLERALAASRARWRIVYGHHPLYSTGRRHASDVGLRQKLEPLLLVPYASRSSSPVALLSRRSGAETPSLSRGAKSRDATGSGAGRAAEASRRAGSGLGVEGRGAGPRAQVVLAGHDHFYQRFHPQKGISYFVCGGSGKLRRGNARPRPLVAAIEDQQRAFMLWEATPDALRFRAINEQGEAFDCGIIPATGQPQSVACANLASPAAGSDAARPAAPAAPPGNP
ncbi:MAG: metallophosphoesterase [Terriglobia bacterium]